MNVLGRTGGISCDSGSTKNKEKWDDEVVRRFLDKNGKETNDEKLAAKDPKSGEPVPNPERNIWVTSTALSTALHTAYFAESVSTWSIVMGFALLLTGVGFFVLTSRLLRVPRRSEEARRQATAVPVPS